jgi:hypothetical protein
VSDELDLFSNWSEGGSTGVDLVRLKNKESGAILWAYEGKKEWIEGKLHDVYVTLLPQGETGRIVRDISVSRGGYGYGPAWTLGGGKWEFYHTK